LLTLPIIPQAVLVLLLTPVLLAGCAAHSEARSAARSPEQAPNEATLLVQKGKAAVASGDTVRAEQYFTLAIARGAGESVVLKDLLAACIGGSRLRGALDHALPYLQKHPDDDDLRYLVASLYDSLGQRQQATTQLERLLHRNSGHADAHYLAGILASEEEPEQAREHFRQYLDLQPQGPRAAEVRGRLSELALRSVHSAAPGEPLFAERGPQHAEPSYEPETDSARTWVDVRYPRTDVSADITRSPRVRP
jgi:tetratricopeptide (TPR) repeat protein